MGRYLLALSSLSPLFAIFAIRTWQTNRTISFVLTVLLLQAIVGLVWLFRARKQAASDPFRIKEVRDETSQVPAYLITYIFPFLFTESPGWTLVVAYCAFALLLLLMLARTDFGLVNPLLLIAGYHLYVIADSRGREAWVATKERPLAGQDCQLQNIAGALHRITNFI